MKAMKKKILTVGFFILTVTSAWGGSPVPHRNLAEVSDPISPDQNTAGPEPLFDKVFPYYTMECSLTQWEPAQGAPGGHGGHVLIYLKGVCRDQSIPYPKIKMCDEGTDLGDPNSGVTLSADKILENTEYIATDGQQFLFHGDLKPGQVVDEASLLSTREAVVKSGAARGIKIHPEFLANKPAGMSDEEYIAKIGADTDYAISIAREASCVRIPMNRAQVQAEVDFVNSSNEPYVSGKKIFYWNGPGNNCTNFTHDVLAAAGIRKYVARTHNKLLGIWNILTMRIQVPRNETLKSEETVNKVSKIGTAEEVFNDEDSREIFEKLGTLPETGGLFQIVPMDLAGNQLYKLAPGAMMLDTPLIQNRHKDLKKVETDADYTDLATNIKRVRDRLVEVQQKRIQQEGSPVTRPVSSELAEFSHKYNAWVYATIIDLNQKLALLSN
jgi:hypothetical protein